MNNTIEIRECIKMVEINSEAKITRISGDYIPNLMSEYDGESGFEKSGNFRDIKATFTSTKLIRKFLKNLGLKYSIESFYKLGLVTVRLNGNGYTSEYLNKPSRLFKVNLDENGMVHNLIINCGYSNPELRTITAFQYISMCKLLNIKEVYIQETSDGYKPSSDAYQQMKVVDKDGFLVNLNKKEQIEDSFFIANIIRVMGYGGGPGYVRGAYYEGKFAVYTINDFLFKIVALEDSKKDSADIFKGFESIVSSSCIQEMF